MPYTRKIKYLLPGLILIFNLTITKAQLFEDVELYKDVVKVKGKYYNGSGGGAYWSLDYVDSLGRIIVNERYHKKQLMSSRKIEYDHHNNRILDIQTYDFNNPDRTDTLKYEYKYSEKTQREARGPVTCVFIGPSGKNVQ
jgi:hypothetical protein